MTKTLVLGLGNEILADDAVGVLVARQLKDEFAGRADVISCALHGLALLELFIGYERAILIDAIQTGKNPPGTIMELRGEDLDKVYAPSPHYAGVPEMLELAEQLELDFPKEFRIFAVEVGDMRTIGGPVTAAVAAAIPAVCERVKAVM
ncbi:MAG: hydrogenase maturation protease [Planctomycetota bacterium]|nr:hydrogenase maturation protease [Planctomycetota bacterium]